jgi:hypothetical protein
LLALCFGLGFGLGSSLLEPGFFPGELILDILDSLRINVTAGRYAFHTFALQIRNDLERFNLDFFR